MRLISTASAVVVITLFITAVSPAKSQTLRNEASTEAVVFRCALDPRHVTLWNTYSTRTGNWGPLGADSKEECEEWFRENRRVNKYNWVLESEISQQTARLRREQQNGTSGLPSPQANLNPGSEALRPQPRQAAQGAQRQYSSPSAQGRAYCVAGQFSPVTCEWNRAGSSTTLNFMCVNPNNFSVRVQIIDTADSDITQVGKSRWTTMSANQTSLNTQWFKEVRRAGPTSCK